MVGVGVGGHHITGLFYGSLGVGSFPISFQTGVRYSALRRLSKGVDHTRAASVGRRGAERVGPDR